MRRYLSLKGRWCKQNVFCTIAFESVLYNKGKFYYNSGYFVNVVDTVGAGDSFLATLIIRLLKGKSPQKSLNYACAIGALVAASEGANPDISIEQLKSFMNN